MNIDVISMCNEALSLQLSCFDDFLSNGSKVMYHYWTLSENKEVLALVGGIGEQSRRTPSFWNEGRLCMSKRRKNNPDGMLAVCRADRSNRRL